jgi:hypothetical protein
VQIDEEMVEGDEDDEEDRTQAASGKGGGGGRRTAITRAATSATRTRAASPTTSRVTRAQEARDMNTSITNSMIEEAGSKSDSVMKLETYQKLDELFTLKTDTIENAVISQLQLQLRISSLMVHQHAEEFSYDNPARVIYDEAASLLLPYKSKPQLVFEVAPRDDVKVGDRWIGAESKTDEAQPNVTQSLHTLDVDIARYQLDTHTATATWIHMVIDRAMEDRNNHATRVLR